MDPRKRQESFSARTPDRMVRSQGKYTPVDFLVDILRYTPSAVVPALITVMSVAVFTRVFTPAEYGIYSLVMAVVGPVVTLFAEWAGQPVGRFYAEYVRRGRGDEYRALVGGLGLLVGSSVLLVSLLLIPLLLALRVNATTWTIYWAATALVTGKGVVTAAQPMLPASLRTRPYTLARIATAALSFLLSVVMIIVAGANVLWLVVGQAAANLAVAPYVYRSAGIWAQGFSRLTPRVIHTLHRFFRFGAPMSAWMLAAGLLSVGDRYVVQMYHGAAAVGIYSVNYNLVATATGLISSAVAVAAFPTLMKQWGDRRFIAAKQTLSLMTDVYFLLGVGVIGLVATIGRPLVQVLLGTGFEAGYVVQVPVAAGAVLWGASLLGHKTMEFAERTDLMVWDALAAALINVVLNFVFVPTRGYLAAAYTTLASYFVYVFLIWFQARNLVPWNIPIRGTVKSLLAGVVAYAVVQASGIATGSAISTTLIGTLAFAFTYLVLLVVLRVREIRAAMDRKS